VDRATHATNAFFEELEKLGAKPDSMKIMYVGNEFGAGHISQAKNLEAAAKKRGIKTESATWTSRAWPAPASCWASTYGTTTLASTGTSSSGTPTPTEARPSS
jgi:hypothetical protein